MSYSVQTRWGSAEQSPSVTRMREILKELDDSDPEHPDVWLAHESGWTLSLSESGFAIWEDVESPENEPRHMIDVDRDRALWMWMQLSRGDFTALERLPWQPGRAPNANDGERDRQAEQQRQLTLDQHKHFYDALGREQADHRCARDGCQRGIIEHSLLCRVHHFENVMRCPCPFTH